MWPALSRGSHGWEYMYWWVGWGDAEQTPNTPPPPGTSRPGAPDQCYHSWAMAQFDFSDYLASPSVKGAPNAS